MKPLLAALFVLTGCTAAPLAPSANLLEGTTVHLEHGGSADIRTTSVRRGELELSNATTGAGESTGDVLLVPRESFVESFEARGEGFEQSWTFPTKPSGTGDLVVEVELIGAQFESVDARGVTLSLNEKKIIYTHGVWIDADGRRSAVPVHYDTARRRLRMIIKAVELLRSSYPSVLDPQIIISPGVRSDRAQSEQ